MKSAWKNVCNQIIFKISGVVLKSTGKYLVTQYLEYYVIPGDGERAFCYFIKNQSASRCVVLKYLIWI